MTLIRLVGMVAIGGVVMKLLLDRQGGQRRQMLPRPRSIERWENEGGAVPISSSATTAQVAPRVAPQN